MVELEDSHHGNTTLGLGPLGDQSLPSGGANALGKAHMSIGLGAGTSTPDGGPGSELHTYIRHLERKIDDLTTVMDRDRHVRDELAAIKHLLLISPSHSIGSHGGRRSHQSPPQSRGGARMTEHQSRPSVKDHLDLPEEARNRADFGRRNRSHSPNPKGPHGKQSAFRRLGEGSVSASSTHSVRNGKGFREPTPSFTRMANEEGRLLEVQTKGYSERMDSEISLKREEGTRRKLFFYALVTMLFLSWVRGFKIYHFFVAFIVVEDKMLEGFDLVIVMAKPT